MSVGGDDLAVIHSDDRRRIVAKTKLRGQPATLERLRADRQLEEALACGPDPLHLAAVFGLDPKTAIRYAENARSSPPRPRSKTPPVPANPRAGTAHRA